MKRITALLCAALMCISVLVSCSGGTKNAAMSVKDSGSVSINFLYLLTSIHKSMYSELVNAYGGDWDYEVSAEKGTTFSDMIYDMTVRSARSSLICEYLHDKVYSLPISDEQKKNIDGQIDSLVAKYGSKQKLEEALSVYSADISSLRRYLELSVKQADLYTCFYRDDGECPIPQSEIRDYFKDNYSIVTHIYFNIGSKQKEDGTYVSFTEDEIARIREKATDIYNRILAGEDFYELRTDYSEDVYEEYYYPNGFFVTNDTTFPTEFTKAALDMKVGEYRMVESSGSGGRGIHIMYRLPMDADLYNTDANVYNTIKNLLEADDFEGRIAEYADLVTENQDIIAQLNVRVVPEYAID